MGATRTTHGEARHGKETTLYRRWTQIKSRVKSNRVREKWYRGSGVTVCPEWLESYDNFKQWAIRSGYREGLTLDRINTYKDYSPENCRWVDRTTQMHNRRDNYWITAFGESKLAYDWIKDERCVVCRSTISSRVKRGWSGEDAISTPPKRYRGGMTISPEGEPYWSEK